MFIIKPVNTENASTEVKSTESIPAKPGLTLNRVESLESPPSSPTDTQKPGKSSTVARF